MRLTAPIFEGRGHKIPNSAVNCICWKKIWTLCYEGKGRERNLPPHTILSDDFIPFWIAWVEKLQWLLPISCFMVIAKHKRILFAVNGMIFALRLKTPDVPPALLYDFNDMKYERLPAPYACPDSMWTAPWGSAIQRGAWNSGHEMPVRAELRNYRNSVFISFVTTALSIVIFWEKHLYSLWKNMKIPNAAKKVWRHFHTDGKQPVSRNRQGAGQTRGQAENPGLYHWLICILSSTLITFCTGSSAFLAG